MTVRTRFAPSPTGYMHIGGMRTALFNWLWARHNGGQFILRIDDTDQQRNRDEAIAPILSAFRWLGLEWDEGPETGGPCGPYFQSQRGPSYQRALDRLLQTGHAYRDFERPQETQAQKESAEKARQQYLSSRVSLSLSPDEREHLWERGEPFVVRLLIPRTARVVIDDHVRGRVEWDCGLMPDPVIARSDGSPLYNFATAVDDAEMRITHVIRAEEHLSNTPIQVLLHQALGNTLPEWAHVPFVAAPGSKEKLSKRKIDKYRKNPQFQKLFDLGDDVLRRIGRDAGSEALSPVMVEYYRQVGFLPEGVLNALARLGWSLDDHTEYLSLPSICENFSLDRIIRSSAGLDPDKLMSFQSHWMARLPLEQKVRGCAAFLADAGLIDDPTDATACRRVSRAVMLAGDRLRVFGDIFQLDELFVDDDQLVYDEKSFLKRVVKPESALDHLRELRRHLTSVEDFSAQVLHDLVAGYAAEKLLRTGELFPALRLCVTGKVQGADLFGTLELLGREHVLKRLDRSLGLAESARIS